jgi:outer membrane protein
LKHLLPVILLAFTAAGMTLEEAVAAALEGRGDVLAAESDLASASWARRGADLWFLPSVSAEIGFQRFHDITEMSIPGMGTIPMGTEYASQIGITAAVPLFTAMGPAGSDLAGGAETLAAEGLRASRQDAVLQVVQAFYGTLLAEMMVQVSEQALATSLEGYELAQQRFDAGTISRFELLQSRVAYENRIPEALSAGNALKNAEAALSVSIGLPDSSTVEPEGSLTDPLPFTCPASLDEARRTMEARSPDLATADGIREVGEAGVRMAAAGFAPSVFLSTSYAFQAQRDDWHFDSDDYERSWTTSIGVSIPVFDGLSDISSYNSARADMLANSWRAGSIEQAAGLGLVQAWNDLCEARELSAATASTVAQAEEGASIARVSYEAGVITRLDMDQAFLAHTAAMTNHASALYALRMAEARLARAMGVLEIR